MTRSQLNIDHVARVEGHGNVHVVIEDDVVKTVEMNIVEPARLFESMVRGQSYKDCSYISSRICGICSPSHCVTDLKAVEDAFGIEVSPRTKMLISWVRKAYSRLRNQTLNCSTRRST